MPIILSEIWIYPVKSLGGIRLTEAAVEQQGLQYDRRWLVVDENGIFQTQRTNLKMALIDVALSEQGLILSDRFDPNNQSLVPFRAVSNQPFEVRIWKDFVVAVTVCDTADAWLTAQLGKKVRIVEMQHATRRPLNPAYASQGELVSFADDFPYLLISEASLADLNGKLETPVEMKRFRPNFVVSGTEPFAEDAWKYIKIGDINFHVALPCERCVLTTIDTITGLKGPEPLKTLSTYRKVNKKILFGQNLIALETGKVFQGQQLFIMA